MRRPKPGVKLTRDTKAVLHDLCKALKEINPDALAPTDQWDRAVDENLGWTEAIEEYIGQRLPPKLLARMANVFNNAAQVAHEIEQHGLAKAGRPTVAWLKVNY